ncbi:MAG: hypothetical protein SW127_12985 [Actinomycetota bacterium]|nr:hypothetical protein [Actinomycetota bacterium]
MKKQTITWAAPHGQVPSPADGLSVTNIDHLISGLNRVSAPIDGNYRGTIVALGSLNRLPRPLRTGLTQLISRSATPIWRGKTFDGAQGANLWMRGERPMQFGGYDQVIGEDGALLLNYDVSANPRPLTGIRGDLWELGAGTYLGRMRYQSQRSNSMTIMYFTLER